MPAINSMFKVRQGFEVCGISSLPGQGYLSRNAAGVQ